jgi:uncharacterized protein YecT (DUF1311 family)
MSTLHGKAKAHTSYANPALAVACLLLTFTAYSTASPLEQAYQKALEDPDFKTADGELNEAYSRGMRTLPKEERDKLRQAERFWIHENRDLIQQNPDQAVELLKKRFVKRRDELLQLNLSPNQSSPAPEKPSSTALSATAPTLPTSAVAATLQTPSPAGSSPAGWNEKVAANLERVYQRALLDTEFSAADSALRAIFKQAVTGLPTADREKLKTAQKAWVRENAVLVAADTAKEQALLLSRVVERKAQLERMRDERRFEPSADARPPVAPIRIAAPLSLPDPVLPPPVLKEPTLPPPSLPPPPLAETAPTTEPGSTPASSSHPSEPHSLDQEPSSTKPAEDPHQFFWGLLGTWILGAAFFHYRAFARTTYKPQANPQPPLNVKGLYLATGTGFLVSLIPLWTVPSSVTAVVAVLFTIAGLGTAKVAAEECARALSTPLQKPSRKPQKQERQPATVTPRPAQPATVSVQPAAVPIHAELQNTQPGRRGKGNRQKRRNR